MARRIWIVSELYYPEDAATGYFLTGIAEGLAAGHHDVHVICGQPSYWSRGTRAPRREERNGVRILRCRGTTLNKDRLLSRLVNLISITVSMFFAALFHIRREDLVLVVTNPPSSPLAIALATRLRRARCVIRVEDVYPEALFATGLMSAGSLAARIAGWLTRRLYLSADRIVVLGRDMEQLVGKRMGHHDGNLVRIPNWADVAAIRPGSRSENSLLRKLGLADKFVVQYSGTIGRTHGIESILEVARRLRDNRNIHFLFIGAGAKKKLVDEAAANLPNVTALPLQPRSELSTSLNACDAAIISFIPGMSGVSVPSRMYNVLAAGKPIIAIAEADSELARLVSEEQVGWILPAKESHRLDEVILQAASQPQRMAEMADRARRVAETYAPQKIIDLYSNMLESM